MSVGRIARCLPIMLALTAAAAVRYAPTALAQPSNKAAPSIADYFTELARLQLVDVDAGSQTALTAELRAAEELLRAGDNIGAAVALYAIVESPRFAPFDDFVGYQNAEYYLAVALANAGAYDSALRYLIRVMERGPALMYFAPAHRRAVDIALETRRYGEVLQALTNLRINQEVPPEVQSERIYLRARIAYGDGALSAAEKFLTEVSRESRLYSSALYLRGVIRTRLGQFDDAAEALCEVAGTPDSDRLSFVVDNRYFTIKDLARLGLGRLAHERAEYDDAYYHYFQIPDDSQRLPEALFEAAWSMYQKRELSTARDLMSEFLRVFPSSPLTPEAHLLAGYIELADCEFEQAGRIYDRIIKELSPVVAELERLRKQPAARQQLFAQALTRYQEARNDQPRARQKSMSSSDKVLALLRISPSFIRLSGAVVGLERSAGSAAHVVRAWSGLARRISRVRVGAANSQETEDGDDRDQATALLDDVQALDQQVRGASEQLRRGLRQGTIAKAVGEAELTRLRTLRGKIRDLGERAKTAAQQQDLAIEIRAAPALGPMLRRDISRARALQSAATTMRDRLGRVAQDLAKESLDELYASVVNIVDKAKLGKIDAVIGQKQNLDIAVSDLAAGRYPSELHGKLWEQGLIADDEEFWPQEGEYWADEYEGWR